MTEKYFQKFFWTFLNHFFFVHNDLKIVNINSLKIKSSLIWEIIKPGIIAPAWLHAPVKLVSETCSVTPFSLKRGHLLLSTPFFT
jgi:hypothetical protein